MIDHKADPGRCVVCKHPGFIFANGRKICDKCGKQQPSCLPHIAPDKPKKESKKWEVFSRIEPADRFGPQEDTEVFAIRWSDSKKPVVFYHFVHRDFLDEIVKKHNKCV